jgi:hypothetical protein
MTPREQIYSTLFSLVASTSGIKTSGRRVKQFTEVNPADQPAVYMVQKRETAQFQTKLPTKWQLHVDFILYGHNSGQPQVSPMTSLNPIIDSIVNALQPAVINYEQTLGGLCERCRIDGDIITDEGVLGDQAIVVIPVTIFLPQ